MVSTKGMILLKNKQVYVKCFFKWNIRNNPKIQSEFYHCEAVGPTLAFWFQH